MNFKLIYFIKFRYYNSEEISLGDNSSIVVDVNDEGIDMLIFENLNHSMSGVYQCSVSNELGEGLSDTLMIDVLCKLEIPY